MEAHNLHTYWIRGSVGLAGFSNWQPACTVDPEVVQAYFAAHGEAVVEQRREKRSERREEKRKHPDLRLVGTWSSARAKTTCSCKTHKDSEDHEHDTVSRLLLLY
jgi:hypothetical protein